MVLALLCETCGYEIAGLPEEVNCSECGRPVADSLPSRRAGSPWQRRPSPGAWAATNVLALRRAATLYDGVRIDVASGIGLAAANLLLAALLIVLPWSGVLMGDPLRARAPGTASFAVAAVWGVASRTALVASLLFLLTMIEWGGIQLGARWRGWRLTPAAAWQVCAHATAGWIVAALTTWVGLIAYLNLASLGAVSGPIAGTALRWGVPGAWALLGMMVFELLVWTGMSRCRFANPPGAPDARPLGRSA
jgi:hypothetical protein